MSKWTLKRRNPLPLEVMNLGNDPREEGCGASSAMPKKNRPKHRQVMPAEEEKRMPRGHCLSFRIQPHLKAHLFLEFQLPESINPPLVSFTTLYGFSVTFYEKKKSWLV
jgi:hypothetical protein